MTNWQVLLRAFDSFPHPKLDFDEGGEIVRGTWIFRGHQNIAYALEPSIERAAKGKSVSWAVVESMVLEEFRAKAPLHMDVAGLTPSEKISWLATMQHHGIPTRLLDFTYSPYVALYFALRYSADDCKSVPPAVWAIDASAVLGASARITREADAEERDYEAEKAGNPKTRRLGHRVSMDPRTFVTGRDRLRDEGEFWARALSSALAAEGVRRIHYERRGLVAFALPPVQNRRLSSQQGAFLLNGAEGLSFQESLFKMMINIKAKWCRLYEIPPELRLSLERKLFQMNLHDLSLFPDIEGLAGFIRQKIRLHWSP